MKTDVYHFLDESIKTLSYSLHDIPRKDFDRLLDECERVIRSGHKIIASGLGKNVPICEKFVGTMWSLGFNAGFLHTNTAVHGDLGMIKKDDLVILITKSGSTQESIYLNECLKNKTDNVWLLSSSPNGVLSKSMKNTLIVPLEHEGDKWDIVPNNSSTLYLIILQTIAMQLADRLDITLSQFKENHPGGAIGARLKNEK